jgi:hypothetical protein
VRLLTTPKEFDDSQGTVRQFVSTLKRTNSLSNRDAPEAAAAGTVRSVCALVGFFAVRSSSEVSQTF